MARCALSTTRLPLLATYQQRRKKDRYSRRVSMMEIAENDYNLNISRYVTTAIEEAEIDLENVHERLVAAEKDIIAATQKHNEFLEELGLPLIPYGELNLDGSKSKAARHDRSGNEGND